MKGILSSCRHLTGHALQTEVATFPRGLQSGSSSLQTMNGQAHLDDVQVSCASAAHIHDDWVYEGALCKGLDLCRHGGREHERLALPLHSSMPYFQSQQCCAGACAD